LGEKKFSHCYLVRKKKGGARKGLDERPLGAWNWKLIGNASATLTDPRKDTWGTLRNDKPWKNKKGGPSTEVTGNTERGRGFLRKKKKASRASSFSKIVHNNQGMVPVGGEKKPEALQYKKEPTNQRGKKKRKNPGRNCAEKKNQKNLHFKKA